MSFMPENILRIWCMALEFINLRMVTDTRVRGMKEEDKDWEGTLSEMGNHIVVTGRMGHTTLKYQGTLYQE